MIGIDRYLILFYNILMYLDFRLSDFSTFRLFDFSTYRHFDISTLRLSYFSTSLLLYVSTFLCALNKHTATQAYGDASGGGKSVCVPRLHHLLGAKSYNERLNHRERRFGVAAAAAGGGERPMQGEEGGSSKDTVVVQCCAAFEHSMVMTSTGQVLTFGLNTAGKLGIGTNLSIGGHNGGSELQVSIPSRQSHGYLFPNIHVPPFEVPLF
jgi:hypothetical protein